MERHNYRMKYDPALCNQHYQGYTVSELVYMCHWYKKISSKEIALALGRTQEAISRKIWVLQKSGEFEYYQSLAKV